MFVHADCFTSDVPAWPASVVATVSLFHPNPASATDRVSLLLPDNVRSAALFDVLGRIAREIDVTRGARSAVIDAAGLAPGMYRARIATPHEIVSAPLVIVR